MKDISFIHVFIYSSIYSFILLSSFFFSWIFISRYKLDSVIPSSTFVRYERNLCCENK